jgi:hypothetical protein
MLDTRRVAEDGEDPSMAALRPILSSINRRGFVTTDSQRGGDDCGPILATPWVSTTTRERTYISGFMLRQEAHALKCILEKHDGVLVLVMEFDNDGEHAHDAEVCAPIPLTLDQDADGTYDASTQHFFHPRPFEDEWIALLPELDDIKADEGLMDRLQDHVVSVTVIDMEWSRQDVLFGMVDAALQGDVRLMPAIQTVAMGDLEHEHVQGRRSGRAPPGATPNAEFERCIVDALARAEDLLAKNSADRGDSDEWTEGLNLTIRKLRSDLSSYRAMF